MDIDHKQLEIKLGDYATGPITALPNSRWLGQAQTYRRTASARMIPLDKPGLEYRLPKETYHVSRKIDGEFTLLIFAEGDVVTLNPGGTVRVGLPWMKEAADQLEKHGMKSCLIAGELYVNRPDGKRPRVHDVTRLARKPETKDDLDTIRFAAFDIVEWNGEPPPADYTSLWKTLCTAFHGGSGFHPVDTVILNSPKEILKQFEIWVETEGNEGIVARSDAAGLFKVKPRHTIDAAAIGFAEGIDDRAGLLHDILLGLAREDGTYQVMGRVGGGFTEDQRRELLSDFQDLAVDSDYAEVNSDRVAYQMIRPEKVVEISCLDIISQTTRGGDINRMVLRWDADSKKWHPERRLPLASILSPEFLRVREDKTPSPQDCGLRQLTTIVEIAQTDKSLEDLKLPKSAILRRVVYTKEIKGKTMVRKLLLWKTGKETQSPIHPAYVLMLTDFSPNRKDPLDREVRVSQSLEQLERFWDDFAEKYFVRGWKPVAP